MTTTRQDGTVYVVDDELSVMNMLQALVATIGVDVRAFVSAKEFLAAYRPTPGQCLVCDLRMPDIDGMELQKRLSVMAAPPPIIFLTGFAEVSTAVEAMRHGAFDFLQKPFSAQALLSKIQSALDHSRVEYAKWLGRQAVEARMALLTPRERNVVRHVVDGKSSREISELLSISVRTVENHRTRIMEKLHVESTVAVVKLFLQESSAR
jgi:two-component system response regulator FixJ